MFKNSYGKRDNFDFDIVNFSFLGDVVCALRACRSRVVVLVMCLLDVTFLSRNLFCRYFFLAASPRQQAIY